MTKWNKEGLPHKGWECLDVIDLAEYATPGETIPYEQCEMCGNEKIRYAHVMIHPEYPEEIHVGCVCAEKMTDDYDTPRKRETAVRNRTMRKNNFNKVQWRFNREKRTYSKKYKGEYITIMQSRYGNWGVFFAGQKIWEYDGKKIRSFDEAEKVAFYIFEEYHTTQEERDLHFYLDQLR